MSDSVDRVFAHALQTVRRIPRTSAGPGGGGSVSGVSGDERQAAGGIRRPPAEDRLKLYGLFKQSTEGDVEGVMERPRGNGDAGRLEREKWDAWNSQKGLSKTEAKRRYISTLIETMHKYASDTPEAQELVSELEFVWNQVKSNQTSDASNTASRNSPSREYGLSLSRPFDPATSSPPPSPTAPTSRLIYPPPQQNTSRSSNPNQRLQIPQSRRTRGVNGGSSNSRSFDQDEDEDDEDEEINEFDVDAPEGSQAGEEHEEEEIDSEYPSHLIIGRAGDIIKSNRWKVRVEKALAKMNAEVAALREQLEARNRSTYGTWFGSIASSSGSFHVSRRKGGKRAGIRRSLGRIVVNVLWVVLKHLMVDVVVVGVLVWWASKRGNMKAVEAVRWVRRIMGKRDMQQDGN